MSDHERDSEYARRLRGQLRKVWDEELTAHQQLLVAVAKLAEIEAVFGPEAAKELLDACVNLVESLTPEEVERQLALSDEEFAEVIEQHSKGISEKILKGWLEQHGIGQN